MITLFLLSYTVLATHASTHATASADSGTTPICAHKLHVAIPTAIITVDSVIADGIAFFLLLLIYLLITHLIFRHST